MDHKVYNNKEEDLDRKLKDWLGCCTSFPYQNSRKTLGVNDLFITLLHASNFSSSGVGVLKK
jgi:hypothetical protein